MTELPEQFLAHCPAGHVVRGTADEFNAGRGWLRCECGMSAPARRMDVANTPGTRCGTRCTRAKGVACHCACIGRNHGSALIYHQIRKRS